MTIACCPSEIRHIDLRIDSNGQPIQVCHGECRCPRLTNSPASTFRARTTPSMGHKQWFSSCTNCIQPACADFDVELRLRQHGACLFNGLTLPPVPGGDLPASCMQIVHCAVVDFLRNHRVRAGFQDIGRAIGCEYVIIIFCASFRSTASSRMICAASRKLWLSDAPLVLSNTSWAFW